MLQFTKKERFSCEAEALKAIEKLTKSFNLTRMETKITPLAKYSKAGKHLSMADQREKWQNYYCNGAGFPV